MLKFMLDVSSVDLSKSIRIGQDDGLVEESIKKLGYLKELYVIVTIIGNKIEVSDGYRRIAAARKLGILYIPCIVKNLGGYLLSE